MVLPEKKYYFIEEAAEKLSCSVRDILQLAADGHIRLGFYVDDDFQVPYFMYEELCKELKELSGADYIHITGMVYLCREEVLKYLHCNFENRNIDKSFLTITKSVIPENNAKFLLNGWRKVAPTEIPLICNLNLDINHSVELLRLVVTEFPFVKEKTFQLEENLPKELRVAIQVFQEFWQDRPQDLNPATEETINGFIQEKMGEKVFGKALERIRTIARPENERAGGAPRSEAKFYKGKSKQNPVT